MWVGLNLLPLKLTVVGELNTNGHKNKMVDCRECKPCGGSCITKSSACDVNGSGCKRKADSEFFCSTIDRDDMDGVVDQDGGVMVPYRPGVPEGPVGGGACPLGPDGDVPYMPYIEPEPDGGGVMVPYVEPGVPEGPGDPQVPDEDGGIMVPYVEPEPDGGGVDGLEPPSIVWKRECQAFKRVLGGPGEVERFDPIPFYNMPDDAVVLCDGKLDGGGGDEPPPEPPSIVWTRGCQGFKKVLVGPEEVEVFEPVPFHKMPDDGVMLCDRYIKEMQEDYEDAIADLDLEIVLL